MAWSEYSRFVGDVFGAPLAMEGLFAFFVESTFLGLWIFGWDRLKPAVHAFSLFMAVLGSWISAFFILVANSWMQHPVGAEIIDGRPRMTDIGAVLMNPTAWVTFRTSSPHPFRLPVASWSVSPGTSCGAAARTALTRSLTARLSLVESDKGARDKKDFQVWLKSLRLGAVVGLIGFAGVGASGHMQAQMMIHEQPMKMAAAERRLPRRYLLLRADRW